MRVEVLCNRIRAAALVVFTASAIAYLSTPAAAQSRPVIDALCRLFNGNNCRVETAPPPVAGDPGMNDPLWTFFQYDEGETSPQRGYVRVDYSFVNGTGSPYLDNNAQSMATYRRSIADWARTMFAPRNGLYVVTLEVRQGADLVWTKPIMAFEYTDAFRTIEVSDDLSFNGSTGFFFPSTQELDVSLVVRFGQRTTLNLTLINSLFRLAAQLPSAGVGSASNFALISSIVRVQELEAYQDVLQRMQLDGNPEFNRSSRVSRQVQLSYNDGGIEGFYYYFRAPAIYDGGAYILKVDLKYASSLLPPPRSTIDIVSSRVHYVAQDAFPTLREFVNSQRPDALAQHNTTGEVLLACQTIRGLFGQILAERDVLIALNALVTEHAAQFGSNWNRGCFTDDNRALLLAAGATIPFEETQPPPEVQLIDREVMDRYLHALGQLSLSSTLSRDFAQSIVEAQGDATWVVINDRVGLLFETPQDGRRQFAIDVAEGFFAIGASKYGCLTNRLFSSDQSTPNIEGMLIRLQDGRFVEVVVRFEDRPVQALDPNPLDITIQYASDEQLLAYAATCPTSTLTANIARLARN